VLPPVALIIRKGNYFMNEKNFNIADLILCDNYTIRGKDAMSRLKTVFPGNEELLDSLGEIYCQPYFEIPHSINSMKDHRDDGIFDDYVPLTYMSLIRTGQKQKKLHFETAFQTKETHKVLRIRGASGTGKSSYLNYLKDTYKDSFSKIIDVNLETAPNKVEKGGAEFSVPLLSNGKSKAAWLFIIKLLDITFNEIWRQVNEISINKMIKTSYEECFGNNYKCAYENLFCVLSKILSDRHEVNDLSNDRQSKTHLFNAILKFVNITSATKTIESILEVMIRMMRCLQPEEKVYLICFDGIEYFTGNNRIYDSDISDIAESIYNFFETESASEERPREHLFVNYTKLLMVVRDTTDKMFPSTVRSYFNLNADVSVDVTRWYQMSTISKEKLFWIEQIFKNIPEVLNRLQPKLEFFKTIAMGSDGSYGVHTSLNRMLTDMYNSNKRRKARILSSVIYNLAELSEATGTPFMSLCEFELWWDQPAVNQYAYLRRRAVLRLIWNMIKQTSYFDCIGIGKLLSGNHTSKNTYAQRILHYLFAMTMDDDKEEGYVNFYDLLCGVFNPLEKYGLAITPKELRDFSEILLALNEARFNYTYGVNDGEGAKNPNLWNQLVVLKYNDKGLNGMLTKSGLAAKLKAIWDSEGLFPDLDEYGVKITSAGQFLTYILSDFEFSASMYTDTPPFVFIRDYDTISYVLAKVFTQSDKLIQYIVESEGKLFNSKEFDASFGYGYNYIRTENNVTEELKYPLRLIRHHKNYLHYIARIVRDYNKKGVTYLFKGDDDELIYLLEYYESKYMSLHGSLVECGYLSESESI